MPTNSIEENTAAGQFSITLDSPAPAGGLTVNFNATGTATLNTDYTITASTNVTDVTNNSFTIAEGQTSALLNINALSDAVLEANESVILKLAAGVGYEVNQPTTPLSFAAKVDYATGTKPYYLGGGDFNGDGKLDLAVTNSSNDTVSVLLRNTTNTDFEPKVDYATGDYPVSVNVSDFNGDSKLDLAIANYWGDTQGKRI